MNNEKYQVLVGNIGTVYEGLDPVVADKIYREYKRQSKSGYGMVALEDVVLLEDDEIICEHVASDADWMRCIVARD